MVVYDLKCSKDHVFEAWFRDSAAFDDQAQKKRLLCPMCGDKKVKKALMAPNISTPKEKTDTEKKQAAVQVFQALAAMREQVEKNCDYVGPQFAEEARKIHYGETGARNIYGEATKQEAEALQEEGVEFGQLPWIERPDA